MHRNRNNRYEDGTQGTRHTYTMLLLFERERTKTKILRTKNMQTCASAHSFSYKLCLVWTRLKHRKTKNYKYSCIFGCLFFGYALDVYFRDAIASEECSSGYGNDVRAQREESVHKFHGIYCVELASSHCLFIRRKKKEIYNAKRTQSKTWIYAQHCIIPLFPPRRSLFAALLAAA